MKKLSFSILNSKELYTAALRIADIITVAILNVVYITSILALLKKALDNLAKALGRSLTSDYTSVLFEKDLARDNAFIGTRDFISAYTHSKHADKVHAAMVLQAIIQEIGNRLYQDGYVKETAELNALFLRFDAAEPQLHIQTIGAGEWYADLKEAQDDFEKTYADKANAESVIDIPLAKKSISEIRFYLDSLLTYINANTEIDAATYTPVANQIDEVITDVTAIARTRKTKEANAKNTEEK